MRATRRSDVRVRIGVSWDTSVLDDVTGEGPIQRDRGGCPGWWQATTAVVQGAVPPVLAAETHCNAAQPFIVPRRMPVVEHQPFLRRAPGELRADRCCFGWRSAPGLGINGHRHPNMNRTSEVWGVVGACRDRVQSPLWLAPACRFDGTRGLLGHVPVAGRIPDPTAILDILGILGLRKRPRRRSVMRREGIRRNLPKPVFDLGEALQRPEVANSLVVGLGATVVLAALVYWSATTTKVVEGQYAADNRIVRLDYKVVDEQATKDKRDEARRSSPRIYVPNDTYLSRLRLKLERLPQAVAGKSSPAEIDSELVERLALNEPLVAALQPFAPDEEGRPNASWEAWVGRFFDELLLRQPTLEPREFQVFLTTPRKMVVSSQQRGADAVGGTLIDGDAVPTDSSPRALRDRMIRLAEEAGVPPGSLTSLFATPFLRDVKPTLLYDEPETLRRAEAAAAAQPRIERSHPRGELIYLRGDRLTDVQVRFAREEGEAFVASMSGRGWWLLLAGVCGLSGLLISLLYTYLNIFYPAVCRRPLRLAALTGLLLGLSAAALFTMIRAPSTMPFVASAAALIAVIVVTLTYDRRMAIFVAAIHCIILSILLEVGPATFIALLSGCGAMIFQLREVRHRSALVRAAIISGVVLGLAMMLAGFIRLAAVPTGALIALLNGLWAAGACVATGFIMLGVLPTLERLFDITTGLTLAELRDPKQPLLRQLQQKAPGTYNHSLAIANVAEAAADAIGADGLLVYVGALYHDIGKMNKPEYFVENQAGGVNKHDRLSPAMSLLLIVGHVKDGIELAREYKLPRSIRHFIESHHGTTLVEYFFHAARNKAEASGAGEESVEELDFRYPGPRPRTKEAAILMISDAVESATRAMAEPTPGRIEQLVRTLARRRLEDGQFDECDLTLRELTAIEDSIIKSVCAIYHGRIAYPGPMARSEPATGVLRMPARAG